MAIKSKGGAQAYQQVTDAFRRSAKGATVADIVARTALPLETVRELAPQVADEYSGRLEVTSSGEIRYSFPRGFKSKYRGLAVTLKRVFGALGKGCKTIGVWGFKVWIMVMLVGYFALFMAIALGSLVLSVAGSSNSNSRSSRRGGGLYLASSIFDLIIRMWFYSELFKTADPYYQGRRAAKKKSRPLHRAIFSFVFGDGDPNGNWDAREKQAVIACIQQRRGVISLPEFMALTGRSPADAEERICRYCVEFGGSPEATPEGTVVYRFDDLLKRADQRDKSFSGFSAPLKGLRRFSSNPKKMNTVFAAINGVNLAFGGYFLYNALTTGHILTEAHFNAASYLYKVVYVVSAHFVENPLPAITLGLGLVPLAFSLFFWLIPALRALRLRGENDAVKLENFRKEGYRRILEEPLEFDPQTVAPQVEECRPRDLAGARDRLVKEMGSYAMPEVSLDAAGHTRYSFTELPREAAALTRYRDAIHPASLGETVFDSDA